MKDRKRTHDSQHPIPEHPSFFTRFHIPTSAIGAMEFRVSPVRAERPGLLSKTRLRLRETSEDGRRPPQLNPAVPINGPTASVVGPFCFLSWRRKRKTDRLDLKSLLRLPVRYWSGEREV